MKFTFMKRTAQARSYITNRSLTGLGLTRAERFKRLAVALLKDILLLPVDAIRFIASVVSTAVRSIASTVSNTAKNAWGWIVSKMPKRASNTHVVLVANGKDVSPESSVALAPTVVTEEATVVVITQTPSDLTSEPAAIINDYARRKTCCNRVSDNVLAFVKRFGY